MEDKILNQMKYIYEEQKKDIEEAKKVVNRILELEQTKEVKEYLKLKKEYDVNDKILNYTTSDMINFAYRSNLHRIKKTNGIYVCLGTFKTNHTVDIEHGSNDYRLLRNDPTAEYRLYENIENTCDIKRIPISKCEEFEQNNQVIIAPFLNADSYFYDIQEEFFKDCILEGQEQAVKKILQKKKK